MCIVCVCVCVCKRNRGTTQAGHGEQAGVTCGSTLRHDCVCVCERERERERERRRPGRTWGPRRRYNCTTQKPHQPLSPHSRCTLTNTHHTWSPDIVSFPRPSSLISSSSPAASCIKHYQSEVCVCVCVCAHDSSFLGSSLPATTCINQHQACGLWTLCVCVCVCARPHTCVRNIAIPHPCHHNNNNKTVCAGNAETRTSYFLATPMSLSACVS